MKYLFIVVGDRPQAGKTTVGKYIAKKLNIPHMSTSDTIVNRVEKKMGLTSGTIKKIRTTDPNAYRDMLIAEGDKMAAENYPPGVACLDVLNGIGGVVDGIRREKELVDTCRVASKKGYKIYTVSVTRKNNIAGRDNTESAILDNVDYAIINDSDVQSLLHRVDTIIDAVVETV